MGRGAQLLLGLAMIAGAGAVDRAAARPVPAASEPMALTLAPLGPVKAIVSSMLWVVLVDSQVAGDERRVATIARALLEVHPGLLVVREYLANQLIVTEAPRAQNSGRHDASERHDALVMLGLSLLEDGLVLSDDPRLHSALGRTLAVQRTVDHRFTPAAERFLGASIEDVAIDALGLSEQPIDAWLRADLLIERGMGALGRGGDRWAATRDLAEAQRTLAGLGELDEMDTETAERMLHPLRQALAIDAAQREPDEGGEDSR
jgi:hypothetical protein